MNTLIDKAFSSVSRRDFLPRTQQTYADEDRPLPIGYGQTNSQPSTVKSMLEWLDARRGHKVLDVGSGSGWTSALLAKIVGKRGHVYATEIVPELLDFGRANCEKYNLSNVTFHTPQAYGGLSEYAPYDRILVSAASDREVPPALVDQLADSGKLVIPVRNDIIEITKNGQVTAKDHFGYAFVPLINSAS